MDIFVNFTLLIFCSILFHFLPNKWFFNSLYTETLFFISVYSLFIYLYAYWFDGLFVLHPFREYSNIQTKTHSFFIFKLFLFLGLFSYIIQVWKKNK